MQTIGTILIFIISSYLNAVNTLADFISNAIEPTTETQVTEIILETTPEIIPPKPEEKIKPVVTIGGSIPQILIDNTDYQKAAVIESIPQEEASSTAYEALVNIYCEHKNGATTKVTTGTGFFIDTKGIILTNAHVAHFLLLDEIIGDTSCVVRTGNPAEPKYLADLLYISPAWVQSNASIFTDKTPKGTGERDYALLYVTSGLDNNPMPSRFPALPFDTDLLRTRVVGDKAYVAGYPADSLFKLGSQAELIPKVATTSITELMTFGSQYADIFSISGTEVGERGSSGGPVLSESGDVIGLISTRGDDEEFGPGSLRAITLSYLDRTITEETGYSLKQNISGNVPFRASIFNQTMVPFLRLVLQQQL